MHPAPTPSSLLRGSIPMGTEWGKWGTIWGRQTHLNCLSHPPQQPHGVPVHPLLCHDGCHEQVKVP